MDKRDMKDILISQNLMTIRHYRPLSLDTPSPKDPTGSHVFPKGSNLEVSEKEKSSLMSN